MPITRITSNVITDGAIIDADINASAAIAYSKLSLADKIVNADINTSAAIAYSKLSLEGNIVNADISATAAIAKTKLNLTGTIANADISTSAAIASSKLATITATGSTAARSIENRFADGLTPKDFGADPSLANNTIALQAWLNSGGNLVGDGNSYSITSVLDIPSNTIINGNGMEFTHNTSSFTSVLRAVNKSNITVSNIKINGRKDLKTPTGVHRAYGFDFQNCENVVVENCYVQKTVEHGIRFGIIESGTGLPTKNIKIINNTVFDCGNSSVGRGAGIWLYGLVNDFIISNNIIKDCVYAGIFSDDSHSLPNLDNLRGVIDGNVINNLNSYAFRNIGIGLSGTRFAVCSNNSSIGYSDAFSFTSVQARTQSGFSEISGNYFSGKLVGARLRNLQNLNFSNNTVITTESTGADDFCINAYSGDTFDANSYLKQVNISNNYCYAYRKGIGINSDSGSSLWADDITIQGNYIKYVGPLPVPSTVIDGINIEQTTGSSRVGKVFTLNNTVIGFNEGIYYAILTPTYCIGNLIEDCSGFGVRTNNATFALIARNTCRNNASADFSVSSTGNVSTTVLKDNEAFSSTPLNGGASTTKQNNLNF